MKKPDAKHPVRPPARRGRSVVERLKSAGSLAGLDQDQRAIVQLHQRRALARHADGRGSAAMAACTATLSASELTHCRPAAPAGLASVDGSASP
jgi:hypothetical protein